MGNRRWKTINGERESVAQSGHWETCRLRKPDTPAGPSRMVFYAQAERSQRDLPTRATSILDALSDAPNPVSVATHH